MNYSYIHVSIIGEIQYEKETKDQRVQGIHT